MKNQLKGSALIVAVMISAVLAISVAGFIFLTSWTNNQINKGNNETKLFWAAESGANHALKWVKRLKGDYFGNPLFAVQARDFFNNSADLKTFKMYESSPAANQVTVNLRLDYDPLKNVWKITSQAVQNGKNVTVTLDSLKALNPGKNAYGITTNKMRSFRVFQSGDTFDGEFYSNGGLSFAPAKRGEKQPRFYSTVYLSKKSWDGETASKAVGYIPWTSERLTGWLRNDPIYANCLLASPGPNNIISTIIPDDNVADFKETLKEIFPKGIQVVDKINYKSGITNSWEALNKTNPNDLPPGIKPFKTPEMAGTKVVFHVTNNQAMAQITGIEKVWVPLRPGSLWPPKLPIPAHFEFSDRTFDIPVGSTDGKYNTILLPGTKELPWVLKPLQSRSQIDIEGVVGGDVSVVTERKDVVITGDIKYSGIDYPTINNNNLTESEYRTKFQAIQNQIKDRTGIAKFSILAGISKDATIGGDDDDEDDNKGDGNIIVEPRLLGTRFISGSLYSPNGVFRSTTLGLGVFKVLVIGGVINRDKGAWHRVAIDMTPHFYDDLRYKSSSLLPPNFLMATGEGFLGEQLNIIKSGYNWNVTR